MCINPRRHPSGLRTPCHHCWQCKENRINDWVGRCIAEKETALHTVSITLTYGGGDTPQSRFLRKSDITAALKALRNAGHKVRFFAAGEYGAERGRAHWHIILFWYSRMPNVEFDKNIHVFWWPHGHTYWRDGNHAGIRYVMKYINKDQHEADQLKSMGMSRKPILGHAFFDELADRYVDSGLSPQRPFYKFRDVLDKKTGKPVEFYMPPLVAERFIQLYISKVKSRHPDKHWPVSDLVDKYHDKMVGYVPPMKFEKRAMRDAPWMLPPDGSQERFDEKLNSFYADVAGERLYWSFDEKGQRAWRNEIVTETEAERRQMACAERKP